MTDTDKVWPGDVSGIARKAEFTKKVSKQDIALFTAISGDHNLLHYDEELARETKFGEIIIQGGFTSAILNAVVAEKLPGPAR